MTAAEELEDAAGAEEILLGDDTQQLVRGRARAEPVETAAWRRKA